MKERPIIFSAPMVRALLEGRKTQTRRALKPQPEPVYGDDGELLAHRFPGNVGVPTCLRDINKSLLVQQHTLTACPYGQPKDRLWVREKWRKGISDSGLAVEYAADFARCYLDDYPDKSADWYWLTDMPWKSPLFMPRWASRITLEITNVRVERVQDISEADAMAEGVWQPGQVVHADMKGFHGTTNYSARNQFMHTWEAINFCRGYGWNSNPWVWAITFRMVSS